VFLPRPALGPCAGDAYDVVLLMDPPVWTPVCQRAGPAVGPPPAGELVRGSVWV